MNLKMNSQECHETTMFSKDVVDIKYNSDFSQLLQKENQDLLHILNEVKILKEKMLSIVKNTSGSKLSSTDAPDLKDATAFNNKLPKAIVPHNLLCDNCKRILRYESSSHYGHDYIANKKIECININSDNISGNSQEPTDIESSSTAYFSGNSIPYLFNKELKTNQHEDEIALLAAENFALRSSLDYLQLQNDLLKKYQLPNSPMIAAAAATDDTMANNSPISIDTSPLLSNRSLLSSAATTSHTAKKSTFHFSWNSKKRRSFSSNLDEESTSGSFTPDKQKTGEILTSNQTSVSAKKSPIFFHPFTFKPRSPFANSPQSLSWEDSFFPSSPRSTTTTDPTTSNSNSNNTVVNKNDTGGQFNIQQLQQLGEGTGTGSPNGTHSTSITQRNSVRNFQQFRRKQILLHLESTLPSEDVETDFDDFNYMKSGRL